MTPIQNDPKGGDDFHIFIQKQPIKFYQKIHANPILPGLLGVGGNSLQNFHKFKEK